MAEIKQIAEYIIQILSTLNVYSIMLRLTLAVLFGGAIGLERQIKRRAAGLRTYMIVCVGAAIVMLTNEYISAVYGSDPGRLGAQVVNGMGFLCVGTIIVTRDQKITGLTTAVGLWVCACVGLALGTGAYMLSFMVTVLIIVIFTFLHSLDSKMASKSKYMQVYLELSAGFNLKDLFEHLHYLGIAVSQVEVVKSRFGHGDTLSAMLLLKMSVKQNHEDVIGTLISLPSIDIVEEM